MVLDVKNFLLEKFWIPIVDESVYYNPYNTIVYALLFGALTIYVLRPLIQKLEIDIDREFFIGFTPFIIFAGALRALKDINAVNTLLLETPFIYLLTFALGILALVASKKLEQYKNIHYHKTLFGISLTLLLITISFYTLKNTTAVFLQLFITFLWATAGFIALKIFKPELMRFEFTAPVSAHYLDATSTFVALSFNANEKHVLGRFFIDIFGPSGMFILKSIVIVPATVYIIREFEGEERMFYLFIITMLGLGIATRNTLQTLGT